MKRNTFTRFMNFWSETRWQAIYALGTVSFLLGAAYISQYVFGLDPCPLCYYQRIPYFIVGLLSMLAIACADRKPCWTRCLLGIITCLFLAEATLAAFHAGVEYQWWKGLNSCGNAALPDNPTAAEMRDFVMGRNITRCDVAAFRLFGISMAGYNFIAATFLFLDMLVLTWWRKRRKQS